LENSRIKDKMRESGTRKHVNKINNNMRNMILKDHMKISLKKEE